MRVGIDVTPLLSRSRTGIAVCTEAIVEGALAAGHEVVGLVSGWRAVRDGTSTLTVPRARHWVPRLLNPLFLDFLQWPKVETVLGATDVYVATNHVTLPARHTRTIALIHDVGRLTHPHLYGKRQVMRFRFMARRCARYADLLVTPTEAVAREVVSLGLVARERVRVVPWFVREFPAAAGAAPRGLPGDAPIMLCVATLERRKNVPQLIRAFQRAARNLPHHLVVAGGPGSDAEHVFATARSNGAADRIHFVGHADTGQLAALYRHADVAICPSLYEGFGLTLVEAMAHGCPVLATDIPAHREVGGEAVRLVPPRDEQALAAGLIELGRDEGARRALRDLGLERSRCFSELRMRRELCELLSSRCAP